MEDYGQAPKLCAGTAPVVSVYLHLGREPGDSGSELALRWRALREQAVAGGATAEQLLPLDQRVAGADASDRTLAAFARGGVLEYELELPDCDAPDAVGFGNVPLVLPLLRWWQQRVPYVVILADRAGADLFAYDRTGTCVSRQTVAGPDDEIERNAPGGWAQARYQRRAIDSWAHNAAQTAAHAARLARTVNAAALLTAGDPRAVQLVTDHLPETVRPLQRIVPGLTYEGDVRPHPRREVVREQVAAAAAKVRRGALVTFRELPTARKVSGRDTTIEALGRGNVSRLLLVGSPEGADALVQSAFAEGADVTVCEPDEVDDARLELRDGVGAILRY